MVSDGAISLAFQPIADMTRGTVAGYEALARFGEEDSTSPERYFHEAHKRSMTAKLDAKIAAMALEHRTDLPAGSFLTINIEPDSIGSFDLDEVLLGAGSLAGVILEITEHSRIVAYDTLELYLGRYKDRGALIALDDTGTGYAGLAQILRLRPSILKLDRELISGIDTDPAKIALVEMIGVFADRIDAWILAEGIETKEEAQALVRLGVPLAQGFYFGRPANDFTQLDAGCLELWSDPLETALQAPGSVQLLSIMALTPWIRDTDLCHISKVTTSQPTLEHLVVLDGESRPKAFVVPSPDSPPVKRSLLVVASTDTVAAVAHRMLTRTANQRFTPVAVVGEDGRYLGTVTAEGIMAALAGKFSD